MSKIDADSVKNSVDIADVVGKYLPLKKVGSEYLACCPFHDEKTPSFRVVPNKQFYYCFGCGAGGDAIDFVMDYTNSTFREACESITGKKELTALPVRKESERVDYYAGYTVEPFGEGTEYPKVGEEISIVNPKRDGSLWTFKPEAVYNYGSSGYVLRTSIKGKKVTPAVRYCKGPLIEILTTYQSIYGIKKSRYYWLKAKRLAIICKMSLVI